MACAVERVKHELCLLLDSSIEIWTREFEQKLPTIFNDEAVRAMFRCSCMQRPGEQAFQPPRESIQRSRRLFATCLIAGKSRLVISFLCLSPLFDDSEFEASNDEGLLERKTGISRGDAKILLGMKHLFFSVNLAMYLRSSRQDDPPGRKEINWLLDEVLETVRKIAFASPSDRRYHDPQSIGDLVIRKNAARAVDRTATSRSKIRRDPITTQSLGFLVLDLIWFILGGGRHVALLDNTRSEGVDWVKRLPVNEFELEPDLLMAFEMVWILIQPPQGSFTLIGEYEFQYVHTQLRTIWPSTTVDTILPRDGDKSRDGSISTLDRGSVRCAFQEVEGAEGFRWM